MSYNYVRIDNAMRRILWIILAWGLCMINIQAQSLTNALVNHYTTQNGLPNNIVNCSLQTRDGFVWLGTWYGLTRFDGKQFRTYTSAFSLNSDPSPRKVETLVEDGNGNIWIKTLDWKLSVLFCATARFKDVFDELKPVTRNLQVIKIQPDGYGNVLLLTKDKNLLLASTDKHGRVSVKLLVDSRKHINRFDYRLLDDVIQLRQGRANLIGTNFLIASVPLTGRPSSMVYWKAYFAQQLKHYHTYVDRYGGRWTMMNQSVLVYYHPKTKVTRHYPFTLFGKITQPTFCDAGANGVFFLTPAGECIHINHHTMEAENVTAAPGMQDTDGSNRFFHMRLDKDGILWLSSTNNGIYTIGFRNHQFRFIPMPVENGDGVKGLYQFANGDVWFGSRNKNLYVLDAQGHVKKIYTYEQYGIGSVYDIMVDHRGRIWLSTKGDGLVQAIPDVTKPGSYQFVHYRHHAKDASSISGNDVYKTFEDSKHRIWVGTLDGGLNLMHEQQGKISFYNKYHGMQGYPGYGQFMEVRNMVEDAQGRLWVGTIDGLMSFPVSFRDIRKVSFETYRRRGMNPLANSDIYALYKDTDRNIWICTFGGGLNQISEYHVDTHSPAFKMFGQKEGLQNDVIITMLQDPYGTIWLGNDHGITSYNPRKKQFRSFDSYDGFPKVRMEESSAINNRNGELWMGCKEGILAFRPQQLKTTDAICPVYIVDATVNNQNIYRLKNPILTSSIVYADSMVLHYDQSMFTLEFAALNYRNQSHVNYRYMLKGYDTDWHYNGVNRIASYTNVPSGTYTFVVEALDSSNPNRNSSREMTIIVLPPWWATWWAYTLYFILFSVVLYFSIRYARYQLELKNNIYIQSKISDFKRTFYLEQQDAEFMNQVKKVLEENLTNSDFDVDLFAVKMGMSRSAFFKRMKALTESSPSDYMKEYKLNHAIELLKNTDMSISDIAYQSGFSDAGYFGKCFRKRYNMSPREFQKGQN